MNPEEKHINICPYIKNIQASRLFCIEDVVQNILICICFPSRIFRRHAHVTFGQQNCKILIFLYSHDPNPYFFIIQQQYKFKKKGSSKGNTECLIGVTSCPPLPLAVEEVGPLPGRGGEGPVAHPHKETGALTARMGHRSPPQVGSRNLRPPNTSQER